MTDKSFETGKEDILTFELLKIDAGGYCFRDVNTR